MRTFLSMRNGRTVCSERPIPRDFRIRCCNKTYKSASSARDHVNGHKDENGIFSAEVDFEFDYVSLISQQRESFNGG